MLNYSSLLLQTRSSSKDLFKVIIKVTKFRKTKNSFQMRKRLVCDQTKTLSRGVFRYPETATGGAL